MASSLRKDEDKNFMALLVKLLRSHKQLAEILLPNMYTGLLIKNRIYLYFAIKILLLSLVSIEHDGLPHGRCKELSLFMIPQEGTTLASAAAATLLYLHHQVLPLGHGRKI